MVSLSLYMWLACPKPIVIPPPPKLPISTPIEDTSPQRTEIMMAWYHTYNNRWDQAQESFRQAHQHAPDDPWVYIIWGDAADSIGDGAQAVWAWERALEIAPPTELNLRKMLYQKISEY